MGLNNYINKYINLPSAIESRLLNSPLFSLMEEDRSNGSTPIFHTEVSVVLRTVSRVHAHSIHSLANGHLGRLPSLAIVNNAAANMEVYIYIFKMLIFNFLAIYPIVCTYKNIFSLKK